METLKPVEQSLKPNETSHSVIIHLSALSGYIGLPLGSILGPLITWLIWRNDSTFTDKNGKEALNFNLSLLLYQFAGIILGAVLFITPFINMATAETPNPVNVILSIPGLWIFIGGFGLISLYRLIMVIIAAIKAGNGEVFHYPLTIRFLK